VHYTIIGDGPLRGELERLVRDLRIEAQVEFGGWRDQAVVAQLMAENDVLLAPSVTSSDGDQEGIPVTLMEAMASGMLVVSTQHSGIPELVEHARSGLLVPERDVAALTKALLHLVHSPELWPAMCAAAREAVQREFEIATLNDRLVGCYRSLLEHTEPTTRAVFAARRRFATN
jgi:colanic acid/amylovoran biosynthesis glycosyltransferase